MPDLRRQPGAEPDDGLRLKLLFDQNLSSLLVAALADVYPQSAHVEDFGLDRSDDAIVWDFARDNSFTIVSKDADFRHRSFTEGAPPRVIWLNTANCSTQRIEALLRTNVVVVIAFHRDPNATFLVLR